MKKIILFIFVVVVLNGCAEYTSFLGPSITVAKTGSVTRAGSTLAASYGLEHGTGLSARSIVEESAELRECKVVHSAEINKIFFSTLDEIDCVKHDPSIFR
tara:strand:+ start:178 stop:480 length:303 start_codon:yes stop_codon:yes gene_type:complete